MNPARQSTRLLRQLQHAVRREGGRRSLSTKQPGTGYGAFRPLLLGGLAVGGGVAAYATYMKREELQPITLSAAAVPASQDSVYSGTKKHALYLTINLKPNADAKACAKVFANLSKYVDEVCPPDLRDEDDEIWAGAGFGQDLYKKVSGGSGGWFGFGKKDEVKGAKKDYSYPARKGDHGPLPSTGGDLFIHAKCDTLSKLFELSQKIMATLPAGSVDKYEDIYGWVYKDGRDLSGFIDGTENAADEEDRQKIAVEKETGGSYVIAQKWIHHLDVIGREKDGTLSDWVGRQRDDSTELRKKAITSHVARMTGGTDFEHPKKFEIVRQSQPYGTLSDHAGLFFIGYAESPENFEYMLKRMTREDDGKTDDIMRLSECVKGTYWYFPGKDELKKLA